MAQAKWSGSLVVTALLVSVGVLSVINLREAIAGRGIRAKPPIWVKDASQTPLPKTKIAGSLSGSPFTIKSVVWKKQMSLTLDGSPVDVMALEFEGTSQKPHGLGKLTDAEMAKMSPEARAEQVEFLKTVPPNGATFLVNISVRQGGTIVGKEFRHRVTESLGDPVKATKTTPVLMGTEVRLTEKDFVTFPYTMRLKFGPKRGSVQPGTINLCLGDEKKSFVAGTFEAVVK